MKISRTDGSTSKEELEEMKNDLHAISEALQILSQPGTPAMRRIIYEPAAEGYKDWNDQLLDKRMETEEKKPDDWEISGNGYPESRLVRFARNQSRTYPYRPV